jgi:CTP:phosphocholine cytidylyltransferase-like protein
MTNSIEEKQRGLLEFLMCYVHSSLSFLKINIFSKDQKKSIHFAIQFYGRRKSCYQLFINEYYKAKFCLKKT